MVKSECLSEMLAARGRLESSPAHKGPTNTNKMSKFLEERKELNYRTFQSSMMNNILLLFLSISEL